MFFLIYSVLGIFSVVRLFLLFRGWSRSHWPGIIFLTFVTNILSSNFSVTSVFANASFYWRGEDRQEGKIWAVAIWETTFYHKISSVTKDTTLGKREGWEEERATFACRILISAVAQFRPLNVQRLIYENHMTRMCSEQPLRLWKYANPVVSRSLWKTVLCIPNCKASRAGCGVYLAFISASGSV